MKIIETNIVDGGKTLNEMKENLSNKIVNSISPILSKEYLKKVKEIKKITLDIEEKKNQIKNEKVELKKIQNELEKYKKEELLLDRIGKLVFTGLIQENMKKDFITLINKFDTMDKNKINEYLNETMRLISQKFAKN